jgi:hypothetical protein
MSESKKCSCDLCQKPYEIDKKYESYNCIYKKDSKDEKIKARDSSQYDIDCTFRDAEEDLDNVNKYIDCDDDDELKKANIITQFLAQEENSDVKRYHSKPDEKPSIRTLMNNYLTELEAIENSKLVGNKNLNNINAIAKISGCKSKSTDDEYRNCLTRYDKKIYNKPPSYPDKYYELLGITKLAPKGGKKHSKKRKNKSNKKHKKSKKNSSIKKRGNKQKRTKKSKN